MYRKGKSQKESQIYSKAEVHFKKLVNRLKTTTRSVPFLLKGLKLL